MPFLHSRVLPAQAVADPDQQPAGILYIDKPVGVTSFFLVAYLRRLLTVRTIGHAGTLDPFASGVMILLVGKRYTRLSDSFLGCDKAYEAKLRLGITTNTYDSEGEVVATHEAIPSDAAVEEVFSHFQGRCLQIPPMFSAKKQQGKKLCDLARQGVTLERPAVEVDLSTKLIGYAYPFVDFYAHCSKGTYIRTIGHDMGQLLGCGGHLTALRRVRSGSVDISQCVPLDLITADTVHALLAKHTALSGL